MNKSSKHPLFVIFSFLVGFLLLNEMSRTLISTLASEGFIATDTYFLIGISFRIFYTLISFWLIKRFELLPLAGLGEGRLKNWYLLLFPLYLLIISGPEPGEIDFAAIPLHRYGILLLYVASVGFAEEFMLRGFLQSFLLKHFGKTKKQLILSVIIGASLFGILHLIKFDKGLYGEISQVFYATFIGTMFGALLLRTNRLWPLVVLHALIDFINNFDQIISDQRKIDGSQTITTPENAMIVTLVVLPCFIYGYLLLRKVKIEDVQKKIS